MQKNTECLLNVRHCLGGRDTKMAETVMHSAIMEHVLDGDS